MENKNYEVRLATIKLALDLYYKNIDMIAVKKQLFGEIDKEQYDKFVEEGFERHLKRIDDYVFGSDKNE